MLIYFDDAFFLDVKLKAEFFLVQIVLFYTALKWKNTKENINKLNFFG